ncbi:MAG TPA: LTA synthase family protein [Opitutaceae bacterium]
MLDRLLLRPLAGLRRGFASQLSRRHGGALLFVLLFLSVSLLTRLALLGRSLWAVSWDASLLAAFAWGVIFDLGAALLFALPLVIALTVLPAGSFDRRGARVLAHLSLMAALALLIFGAVAEWVFWDEFSVRFNFIAVDYLVYTTEVIANIRESYPMPAIFAGVGLAAVLGYALFLRTGLVARWLDAPHEGWRRRYARGAGWVVATALVAVALDSSQLPSFANNYNRELAKDGLWSLFAAFRDNELDYDQFYETLPVDAAFATLRHELASDGAVPLEPANGPAARDTLRYVAAPDSTRPELHPNVIQITVESLSADFLSTFNHASHLTPNFEALARHSLVFENLYATGTRTDRGMEALALALPPTPGRSLIKRPRNEDLFTLGSVFRSRGYDTAFIYGGYGYFDNMNAFFGGNGYRIVDRASAKSDDITFANAWGACDEDLYRWTLREADAAAAANKPFHFFVMTTSNHRPYTYPEGRIDLPPKTSGRAGAVKYTDYAIGRFLRDAETKPWFRNTVFVIVADHCASVAGKTELPVQNYHIPLFIYAPGGQVAPGRVRDLMSQVDYAPTLLGLLNWSYASRFYGWDVLHAGGDRRALIGNYQKLGLYEPGKLEVLKPVRGFSAYQYDPKTFTLTPEQPDDAFRRETIAYYQTASYLYRTGGYRALAPDEQARVEEAMARTTSAAPTRGTNGASDGE